ncbi:velvet factor-domain-containing protein [Mycena sp. CBHHK59/15]|nr:velvet factor-domain-containing protein [Mycena sp. CBHHK59/15]
MCMKAFRKEAGVTAAHFLTGARFKNKRVLMLIKTPTPWRYPTFIILVCAHMCGYWQAGSGRMRCYELVVRQQATTARASTKQDRRLLHPVLAVELRFFEKTRDDSDWERVHLPTEDLCGYFLFASLVTAEYTDVRLIPDLAKVEVLVGPTISSLCPITDPATNNVAAFFSFPEISVRVLGRWRLRLALSTVDEHGPRQKTITYTDVLEVVSGAHYHWQGVQKSTPLTRALSNHGVRPGRRTEPRQSKNKRTRISRGSSELIGSTPTQSDPSRSPRLSDSPVSSDSSSKESNGSQPSEPPHIIASASAVAEISLAPSFSNSSSQILKSKCARCRPGSILSPYPISTQTKPQNLGPWSSNLFGLSWRDAESLDFLANWYSSPPY